MQMKWKKKDGQGKMMAEETIFLCQSCLWIGEGNKVFFILLSHLVRVNSFSSFSSDFNRITISNQA